METLTAEDHGAATGADTAITSGGASAEAQAPRPSDAQAPSSVTGAACKRCGAPLAAGQDWCLQCGTGGQRGLGTPGWRSTAALTGAAAALVLAAGGVGYAALSKGAPRAAVVTRTVAQAAPPPAASPPPATVTPTPTKAAVPATPSIASTPAVPAAKVPVTTPPASTPATTPTGASTTPSSSNAEEPPPGEAIVLDTNAASTYNPGALPVGSFGDPTLAIDGDPATGWTALVEPATAPKMAAGLLVDLNSAQRLGAAEIVTSTPGMTVQLYGTAAEQAPTSMTDPAWKKLTRATVVRKRHFKLTLRESAHSFRFVVLWISRAGAASVGTPQKPGHVSVNELELFPPHH